VLAAQGPRLRAMYRARRDAMETALRAALGDLARWSTPRGGFFIWAALPAELDAEALLERATRKGVIYVVGSAFYVDGSGRNLLRLSFSQPPIERTAEGIERLAAAVREELQALQRGLATSDVS
jgi:2-aminoadipate transaminase